MVEAAKAPPRHRCRRSTRRMLAFRARPLPRTALRARRAAHAKRSATRSLSRASQKSGAASRMCWPSAPRAVLPFAPARQRLQPLQRASLALTLTANAPRSPMRAEVSFECRGPANASTATWHQAHAARAPEHHLHGDAAPPAADVVEFGQRATTGAQRPRCAHTILRGIALRDATSSTTPTATQRL